MPKDTLHITDLQHHAQNANRHTERGREMLATSLKKYGAGRSILLDRNGVIIAGNLTAEYAAECGITNVRVIKTKGDELVAVMRMDLDVTTDRTAKELALADNRVAQVSIDLDPEVLQVLESEGVNLDQFFSTEELDALFLAEAEPTEILETPAVKPEKNVLTTTGNLYEITINGLTNRLLCGDSTNADDVKRLMNGKQAAMLFTDPPYNIRYAEFNNQRISKGSKSGKKNKDWTDDYCSDWKDDMSDEHYATFLNAVLLNAKNVLIQDAMYYVWYASEYYEPLVSAFRKLEIQYDKVPIVWVKHHFTMSWAHYHRQYEACLVAGKGMPTKPKRWFGPKNETNVWQVRADFNGHYIHPTQKPIPLVERALLNSSKKGELILDLFAGSGSTMLAAIQNERYCYTMEQEASFCDAIVRRMFAFAEKSGKPMIIKRNGAVLSEEEFQCAA